MSLAYEDDFKDKMDLTGADHIFCELFKECSNLIDASNLILPATVLADNCYNSMFYNCTSLTTTPELPATIIANGCYLSMFSGCSSLTTTPKLPATTLASNCYNSMFYNCSSLTTAPVLPATILVNGCYESMFSGCTSLTTAPELPATTLVSSCYLYMFYECSNLNHIKALFTTTPGRSYTADWVVGISSTGTFIKNTDATWTVTGNNGIPTGWTVETATA